MAEAHHRKKHPEAVRQSLIDAAIALAESQGIAGITVQAVADAAGVSKGGLFHHFENKDALIEGVMLYLLERLDDDIDALISEDSHPFGQFSRAYAKALLGDSQTRLWTALISVLFTSKAVQQMWQRWMSYRLERHHLTDSHPNLMVLRLAADGAWLYNISDTLNEMTVDETAGLIAELTEETSPLFQNKSAS